MTLAPEKATLLATVRTEQGLRDLIVHWDPDPPSLSAQATARIDAVWATHLATAKTAGHTLFDAPITRLLRFTSTPATLTLRLGPADYKSFLVTRLRDHTWFQAYAPEAIVEALGNSALITRGNRALLALRAPGVSAYPNRWHLIGGVVEGLGTSRFPASRAGLQAHLFSELSEELGLALTEVRSAPWPKPLALARDEFLGQPELFWQWEIRLPLEVLLERLNPEEHTEAKILHREDMTAELFAQLTPIARLAWRMWCDQEE